MMRLLQTSLIRNVSTAQDTRESGLSKTSGDHGTSVAVPVPVPEGVRYDTTVK